MLPNAKSSKESDCILKLIETFTYGRSNDYSQI